MTQLRGETLELVLGYLTAAGDFVRCPAVNRAWAQASNLTQIRVLTLHHNREGVPSALSEIRWLQRLQQRGCLKNWREARLHCIAHSEQLNPLAQGFMMLAGSYRLTKCDLSGSFCLVTALGLLPTSLSSLELWPWTGPAINHMSAFKRFTTLKGLRLGVDKCSEPAEFNGVVSDECMFVIDAPFPCLRSLLHVMTCHLASGCGVTECLPQLNLFSSWLYNDPHGVQLAESVILLGCLQKLKLTFMPTANAGLFQIVCP